MKKVFVYGTLYFDFFLHNYFIMYDIKYFFLNKNNQTIQEGTKKFKGKINYRKHYRKILFFNIQPLAP
jgi:hypothetical protein